MDYAAVAAVQGLRLGIVKSFEAERALDVTTAFAFGGGHGALS